MREVESSPIIAVYTQRYLNRSMTFVYRQLLSVINEFDPIVLTSNKINNIEFFPFDRIFSKKISKLGIIYRVYKKSIGHFTAISPSQRKYFYDIIRRNNVKLVHAHFGPSAIEILPVAKRLNIPLLVTFHGYDASSILEKKKYLNDLIEVFNYSSIVTVSNYMARKIQSLYFKELNCHIIYYGIDLSKFPFVERKPLVQKFKDREEILCLQISNFVEKKGHQFTIEAFSRLLKKYNRCRLILGGEGILLDKIKILTSKLGINDRVQFIGKVDPEDVYTYMKNADVFLHHSITASNGDQEGIPNVLMEAMATGLPVISTYHAGIPELVQDGINGFLVHEKDIEEYVGAMQRAWRSDSEISYRAYRKVQKEFNIEIQSKKLIDLYKKIIGYNA